MLLLCLCADTVFLLLLSAKTSSIQSLQRLVLLLFRCTYTANMWELLFYAFCISYMCWESSQAIYILKNYILVSSHVIILILTYLYLGLVIYKEFIPVYHSEIHILKVHAVVF